MRSAARQVTWDETTRLLYCPVGVNAIPLVPRNPGKAKEKREDDGLGADSSEDEETYWKRWERNRAASVQKALALQSSCGPAHKWHAILLSETGQFEGTTATIKNSFVVRTHFEHAIALAIVDVLPGALTDVVIGVLNISSRSGNG